MPSSEEPSHSVSENLKTALAFIYFFGWIGTFATGSYQSINNGGLFSYIFFGWIGNMAMSIFWPLWLLLRWAF